MALSDRIKQPAPAPVHGSPCSIGEVYRKVASSKTETKALDELLYGLNYNAAQVFDVLTAEGYTIGRQSINRHRGRKCRCYKAAA